MNIDPENKNKPKIITHYSSTKYGTDLMDQITVNHLSQNGMNQNAPNVIFAFLIGKFSVYVTNVSEMLVWNMGNFIAEVVLENNTVICFHIS